MRKFYVALDPGPENTAWYKAIADTEYFLEQNGFTAIPPEIWLRGDAPGADDPLVGLLKPRKDKSGTMVLVQYPRCKFEGMYIPRFIDRLGKCGPGVRTVALVHDLDSVRYGDHRPESGDVLPEAWELNLFDTVIGVNAEMCGLMADGGVTRAELYPLVIFDYLLRGDGHEYVTVAYAGNLKYAKSPFIYKLGGLDLTGIKILLFGPGFEPHLMDPPNPNIIHMGEFQADELPCVMKADFGLCWDGDGLERCEGKIGEYLRYTNPHKASFYLAFGLPVIIAAGISTSALIKANNAGIVLEDLRGLRIAIANTDAGKRKSMCRDAHKLGAKLKNGKFLKNVLKEIEKGYGKLSDPEGTV